MKRRRRISWLGLALPVLACVESGAPRLRDGTPVLFIGNSYLAAADIPGIVEALADSAGGERLAVVSAIRFNYALIDHWNDAATRQEVTSHPWKYVVLQQGPTPAGVCRDTLRLATKYFADAMSSSGATPALFEAWAPQGEPAKFPGTIGSYRLAATDVGGLLLPIAEAWQAAMARDGTLQLYADNIHPTKTGSYLAALVIYTRIIGKSTIGLPATLVTPAGIRISMPAARALLLQEVADAIGLVATPTDIPPAPVIVTSIC